MFAMDMDNKDEVLMEETVVSYERPSRSRDFGWESLASVEQSRQNEIISEIYDLMSNPDDEKIKRLKNEWNTLPKDHDAESVEQRYTKALETYEQRSVNINNALNIKKDLLNRAEMLKDNNNFRETAQKLQNMQKEWKEAGFAGKDVEQEMWNAFRAANDAFFERRSAHFDEMSTKRDEAKTLKEELIKEVELLKDSVDWKATSRLMNDLMNRWKKAGFAGRELDDSLWEQFNGHRQVFYAAQKVHFDAMNQMHNEARDKKQSIVARAQELLARNNFVQDRQAMDSLFDEWKNAGHSGRENEGSLWSTFKAIQDEFFTKMKSLEELLFEEKRNVMEEDIERLDTRIAALENLNDMIDIKLSNLANPSLAQSVKDANKEEVETLENSKEANNANLDEYYAERDKLSRSINKY